MKEIRSLVISIAAALVGISIAAEGATIITITPLLMPTKESASWQASADRVIADARAGTLAGQYNKNGPESYGQAFQKIDWWNLVYSTTTPMWGGQLDPVAPFQNEKGGPVIWNLVIATSTSGQNDLSLDMIRFTSRSNDGNVLGDTVTFDGMSYTPRAIAIRTDGSIIESGPTSQKGRQVYVLIFTKLFNGGNTATGLNEVKNWVGSSYSIDYVAEVVGDQSSRSTARVSVAGIGSLARYPKLSLARSDASVTIRLVDAEAGRSYRLMARPEVDRGPWTIVAIMDGTNDTFVMPLTGRSHFYRALLQ